MSIDYQSNITGFENLFKRMDELRDEIGKTKTDRIWRNVMLYAMEPVLQDAKTYAPKSTGQLADHIYMKAHRPQMRDKASVTYQGESYIARVTSSPIRDDSVLETILNKKGKFQSYWTKKRPVGISNEFGNKRTPKHEFLRPALNNNIDKIQTRLGQALMVQINKIGEGKA
jgi:HK97 gp10 family phage protein